MGTAFLSKVPMDGGSGLNIVHPGTLDRIGIPWSSLHPSKVSFYGIIPRKEVVPLERIRLNVTFDQLDNFCKEPLTFMVVNFPGIYNTILGQPCFTKFMVVPNYTYLKLNMLGPKGVITVEGSFEQAYYYEQDCVTQAAMLIASYAPDDPYGDMGRASVNEVAKAVAMPNLVGVDKAAKTPGGNDASASPSI
ncbi:uncharacterized protein [Miscanthus floridulus]|uniref:uncharacterized protein n=1 Tax=Miscanthus floridulus TaxID=154761 RepID=UPI0034598CB8